MTKDKGRPFDPKLIYTQFLQNKQQWTAFVTWRGMDIQEFGETEQNAKHFLLTRHKEWFAKSSNEK